MNVTIDKPLLKSLTLMASVIEARDAYTGGHLWRVSQYCRQLAEAAGLPCFVNSMIEMGISVVASLHLVASLPNLVDHGHAVSFAQRIVTMGNEVHVVHTGQHGIAERAGHELPVPLDQDDLGGRRISSEVFRASRASEAASDNQDPAVHLPGAGYQGPSRQAGARACRSQQTNELSTRECCHDSISTLIRPGREVLRNQRDFFIGIPPGVPSHHRGGTLAGSKLLQ